MKKTIFIRIGILLSLIFSVVEAQEIVIGDLLTPESEIKISSISEDIVELNNTIKVSQNEISLIREVVSKFPMIKGLDNLLLNTKISKDEVEDRFFIQPISEDGNKFILGKYVKLYIGLDKKNIWLQFKIQYEEDDWLFIDSFKIVADKYKWDSGYCKFERDNGSGSIWEWLDTEATREFIKVSEKISNSEKTIIRFSGDKYYSDFIVPENQKIQLKKMLGLYLILNNNMKSKQQKKKVK